MHCLVDDDDDDDDDDDIQSSPFIVPHSGP